MHAAGFEPAIPATERPQTLALARSATEIGSQERINLVQLHVKVTVFMLK